VKCICHPGPYHRDECPCQAAYLAKRAFELAQDPMTPEEAEALAQDLVASGYHQLSRKYRVVAQDEGQSVTLGIRTFEAFQKCYRAAFNFT
jgi:hypothetical protein